MKKMMLPVSLVCFLVGSVLLFSCNNDAKSGAAVTSFNLDSARAAIIANNKVYGECFATGDSVKFVSCYTADACINPPNMPRMCGTKEISGFFNGGYKMGIRNIKLTTEEVFGGGADAVTEVGKYEVLGDKDVSFDKGKFIVVWKMDNGKWKLHRDIWNSDNPPPPAPPAEKK